MESLSKDSPLSKSEENLVCITTTDLTESDSTKINHELPGKKQTKSKINSKNKGKSNKNNKNMINSNAKTECVTSRDIPMPLIKPFNESFRAALIKSKEDQTTAEKNIGSGMLATFNPSVHSENIVSSSPLEMADRFKENTSAAHNEIPDPVLIYDDEHKSERSFEDWEKTERFYVLQRIQQFFNNRFDIPTILIAIHKSCGSIFDAVTRLNSGEICTNPNILVHPVISGTSQNAERYYS